MADIQRTARQMANVVAANPELERLIREGWANPTPQNAQDIIVRLSAIPAVPHIIAGLSRDELDAMMRIVAENVAKE